MNRYLGYEYAHGPEIAPDGASPERADYGQVVLVDRLRRALERINPDVPAEAIEDALRKEGGKYFRVCESCGIEECIWQEP